MISRNASAPADLSRVGRFKLLVGRALLTASMIVVASTAVVGATEERASAAPLANTPLITFNMQGSTAGSDSKWTTTVGGYARAAEIVALQEAGPTPPGDWVHNINFQPGSPGRSGYVQHHRWRFGHESYDVYFLQTDPNGGTWAGGRNNVALVTQRAADEVHVAWSPGGRSSLGVRFGDNWYFTFHGQSNGGNPNDSAAMTQQIATFVRLGPGRHWTVLGDFNVAPGSFVQPAPSYRYSTGLATHQSGNELDWALSSENVPNLPVRRLPGASSDHYAVGIGAMRGEAQPHTLRILPLGDSITDGVGSLTGAYRGPLGDRLQQHSIVDYVGSRQSGYSLDNDHEDRPNAKISDIGSEARNLVARYQPNLVLLHIGTNDMNENVNVAGAPARLGALIDEIFRDRNDVVLLVSRLVPSANQATHDRIQAFNDAIPNVLAHPTRANKRAWMVDMKSVTKADLADALHPNDTGYRKMADVFYEGIQSVVGAGWVAPPPSGGPVTGWASEGVVAGGTINPGDSVRILYADINGDRKADYLVVRSNGSVEAWLNGWPTLDEVGYYWWQQGVIATGVGAPDVNIRFADLTGDGRADYLLLHDDSAVNLWANIGRNPVDGLWYWFPQGKVATGVGVSGGRIQFADLNADNREDYLDVDPTTGATRAWINLD